MAEVLLREMRADELPVLSAISNRAHLKDGIPQVVDETEFAEDLADVDAVADVRVAELDGDVVGHVRILHFPSTERLERAFVFGDVDPAARGRGVGTALVRWATERGGALLRSSGNSLPKFLRADVYEQVDDAHRLFAQLGYEPVRWFEELLRPLDPLPPVTVDDRYTIEDWSAARGEEILAVRNESFADHWGSGPWSSERFVEVTASYGSRPDLSVVAVERSTGSIVGLCYNEHYPKDAELLGRVDGWISVLGTRAAHRGRGLASAMIHASLARFKAAGFTHASIAVDADSPTGANLLYRALGFEPEQRHMTYEVVIT